MPAKQHPTPTPPAPKPEDTKPEDTKPEADAKPVSEWDDLKPAVSMPNKTFDGNIRVNVLDSIHQAIRSRAEASLAVNTTAVAAKTTSNAKRARVNYQWDVQPIADAQQGERFDKALSKYAKYRPATGDIPFKAEHSPMGQVTCRTGVPIFYKTGSDGKPEACAETDEGAYLGLRYSVRPLEQRGDSNRLPGTA